MKTQVELFELEEVRQETFEQSIEALALIQSLGLAGQQPQVATSAETQTVQRFPYRLMTNEELFVYSQLCPSRSSARTYSDAPIPLEVLKTMAYATSLNDSRISYFEIWSADSSKVKDPVLVARDEQYGSKNYLLARWGDELLPLQVLLPDAIKRWYATRQDALNDCIARLKTELLKPLPVSCPKERDVPYLSL